MAGPFVARLRLLRKFRSQLRRRRCVPAQTPAIQISETVRRNVALEAVRVGNYYAEDPEEVFSYIKEQFDELLTNARWLSKTAELREENGLSRRYTVEEILRKKHEEDGFDIFVDPDEAVLARDAAGQRGEPAELVPGRLGELQEGLAEMVA
eukprot:CAMPEP_0179259082 /NCGR_PEP_ID=MMETSP0797-20121207/25643_1 /TAXON_ID=47934 /ORGANISM="Dinophysis acuminata, Strain DAEP01" /LENGTH=151 /DNA_ID=CAMNT_0020967125 /DNA_START=69 /DNA_END=521 /DNA_ORIENTATION=-